MIVAKRIKNHKETPIRATIKRSRPGCRPRNRVLGPMAQIALAGLVTALLLLAYVTEKNVVMSYSYRLDELETQKEELQVYRDRLALEIMKLKSLDRIDQVARTELGMVEPLDIKYVALAEPTNKTIGSGPQRVVAQVAEYISGFFTSVAKAAGLYEGR
ncbi:MAG: cell division protein FtsL [Firmicutes bacterium]|nr:cell division protein FtsL [Bacillota bacterium]